MQGNDTVKVLKDLIQTSENGEKGFSEAAEIAKDPKLQLLFREFARECQTAAVELQARVIALGGKAEDRGTIAGAAHRGWLKVKSTVEDSNIAVLEEVERGQDHAKAEYSKAAKADLPPELKALVLKQRDGVIRNHDRIRDLRNQYKAAA